jgi:hypothetical protein
MAQDILHTLGNVSQVAVIHHGCRAADSVRTPIGFLDDVHIIRTLLQRIQVFLDLR